MTKRVLAFLLVLALVVSLVPTVVLAEEAAATPGYTVVLQKAHNQTENAVSVDIYLQANTADQAAVTGYDFTVTPAEGLIITDVTGSVAFSSETNKVVYSPENPAITVGTDKVLVTTITVAGENVPAKAEDALTLSDITITQAEGFYSDDAADAETEGYAGTVKQTVVSYACADHACGHGEGTWTAFTATKGELATGKYYLTSDVALTDELTFAKGAEVTICLNGYDMEGASGKYMFIQKAGCEATLNICDCTAAGEGVDYTAGKLLPKRSFGGAFNADINAKATINFYGGVIDGSLHEQADKEGPVAFINATNTFNMFGGKVENFTGKETSDGAQFGAFMFRGTEAGECFATIENVTFVNCGTGILTAPYGSSGATGAKNDTVTLTVRDVTVTDSKAGTHAIDINDIYGGKFKTVTIEGNCRFDAPVYLASGESVILDLGPNADVNITTEEELTEEEFNQYVKMAEGGSLTVGTVLYETAGVFISYADGKFTFGEAHTIADKHAVDENGNKLVFKAWDKTDSLPTEGNWYLLSDVTTTESISLGKVLNLDLNGKTVTTETTNRFYNIYVGTLNLYDGSSTYDAEGNWTAAGTGKLTEFKGNYGVISVNSGGTFNLYSGTISNNGTAASGQNGAAVYVYDFQDARKGYAGGVFNMYGGEITGNIAGFGGAAITTYAPNDLTTIPEDHVSAKINISGGKIYNNTTLRTDDASKDGAGTFRIVGNTEVTISGGEISNNTARNGALAYVNGNASFTITGGTFKDNHANNYGGIIYMDGNTTLNITGGTFTGNYATSGALAYVNNGQATIKNLTVEDHTGTTGAVLYFNNNANTLVEDCTFQNNSATGAASVAYINGTAATTFSNCMVVGNTSGSNGSAMRVAGNATLTLDSTVITGNHTTDGGVWACGALYHTGSAQKVILKGATIIAGNTAKQNPLSADYAFQGNNNAPTVYVNELTAGAHVNIYNLSPDGRAAADLVQIAEGGSQTDWDCGWINYYETSSGASTTSTYKDVDVKNVSRVNGEFVFGHYHGNQEYTAITATGDVTADGYYYLAKDITTTATWSLSKNIHLCFNGNVISSSAASVIKVEGSTANTVTFEDCTGFYNDKDEYIGGGITSTSTASGSGRGLRLNNASHVVTWKGGKIFDITSKATGSVGGTAVWLNKGTLNISGGAICGNTLQSTSTDSTYSLQGIVQMNAGALNITGGHFYGNKVSTAGTSGTAYGVIRPAGGTMSKISNAKFFDNESGYAPAVFVSNTITFENCEFKNNTSAGRAGAIGISLGQTKTGNAASAHTVTVNNCLFEGNTAGIDGGAIYANINTHADSGKTNTLTVNIKNGTSFIDNTATTGVGGAVRTNVTTDSARKGSAAPTVKVFNDNGNYEDILFEGNVSGANGGAIYAGGASEISNAVFTENETTGKGGAFYTENNKATMTNCAFNENSATSTGGAVYASNGSGVYNFTDCDFTGNSGANGAAINIEGGKTFNVKGCNFDSNTATGYGGAICTRGNGMTANVGKNDQGVGCTFTNNTAKNGGAIAWDTYNRYTNTRNVDSCVFTDNYASSVGGAMFVSCGSHASNTGVLTAGITNCTFEKNGAASAGAALGIQGFTNANLSNTTIQNNKDYSTFGAIYLGNDNVNLTLSGLLTIKDNKGSTYPDADIVLRGDANPNPHLIVKDLDPASRIGIQASNARYESDPVMTKETITLAEGTTYEQINDCFFSNAPARFRTYVTAEGQLILTNYVDAEGNAYQTLAEAVAAAIANGETKVTVQAGTSIDKTPVAVTEDLMIDLNGFDVTKIVVSEGKELKLIDSTTNDYTSENAGSAVVEGDFSFYAEDNTNGLRRYVVITNEKGVSSAHRVYLAITTKVLRPTNNGVGFKAIFAGSDVIAENQDMFGIEISTTADFAKVSTGFFTDMTAGIEGTSTPNQKTIILRDVLKEGMDNSLSYNATIYGRPYIAIGEEVVYGTTVSTTMSDLVDAALKSNDATVVEAVNAMLAQFGMAN